MSIEIHEVGIIGAGQMGSGIAQVCAMAAMMSLLHDISEDRIHAGLATVNGNMAKLVQKGTIAEVDRRGALERISPAPQLEDLGDCDIVIEAATENEDVKRKIFTALCPVSSRAR